MIMSNMDWVDQKEEKRKAEIAEGYFEIEEGDNRVQILTHCAPLPLKWTGSKYEPAEEGDSGISIKGVCWLLHDGKLKQAKLPYTVVKAIRTFEKDEETSFDGFPMPYMINIKAKGAGTKEVEYTVIPSRKESSIPAEILRELKEKPTPEEIIEKIKGKVSPRKDDFDYPKDDINPDDIPF